MTNTNGLNWMTAFEIDTPRYAKISDGYVTSCATLAAGQSLADAIEDYRETYDNNGEEGTTRCTARLIEDGVETDFSTFDFAVSFGAGA